VLIGCGLIATLCAMAQSNPGVIRMSEVFGKGKFILKDPVFLQPPTKSLRDTVHIVFRLINDIGQDTSLWLYEEMSDWLQLSVQDTRDSTSGYTEISGRDYYDKVPYDYVYFACRPIRFQRDGEYLCKIDYKGPAYRAGKTHLYLLTPKEYQEDRDYQKKFEYINNLVTYFFTGAIAFGFFFFFFLYVKSRYPVFGFYALFLFLQMLYGVIQFDVYTSFGHFFLTRFNYDDYVSEVLVFIGQAAYVYFMALWLELKSSHRNIYRFFRGLSFFFLAYAFTIWAAYMIDRDAQVINTLYAYIRIASVIIQAVVFYLLLFKVKSPVKGYVLAGTSFVLLFGVGFVAMNLKGWFDHTQFEYFDNGSWYMIGIMLECMCFASGLGLRYFLIDQDNQQLHQENIKALEGKLSVEQEARGNERKLADLNLELTNQQLTALRAQMNPHFIFNALNSIQKYVVTGNIDEANSYLSKFSKLQRMILAYSDENFISLDKELEVLKLYLELEQLRLTNEFHFDIIVDEDIEPEEINIPPMLLQPFAENAIWHGLIPKQGEKKLRIEFKLTSDDVLTCIVDDNGIGRAAAKIIKEEKQANSPVNKSRGMSLVYNRMALLEKKYGKGFTVHVIDKMNDKGESEGTRVELRIPITG
jgi:hypothetical protein